MTNDMRLWLYPGANPNSAPDQWESFYADISQYVRRPGQDGGMAIRYTAGKQDESTQTDAGQMQLTLDNRDGRFSTDKIDGPWYGLIDTNTPIRLGVGITTDPFNRTVSGSWGSPPDGVTTWGTSGVNFSTNGARAEVVLAGAGTAAVNRLTNGNARDVDITSTITPSATATGASYGQGHVLRRTDTSNFIYSTLEFNTAGTTTIKIRTVVAGVVTELASINPIPASTYTAGVSWKLRTQADGESIRVMAWPAATSRPTAWMLTTTETTNTGTEIGVYSVRFGGNTNSGVVAFVYMEDFEAIGLEWTGYVVSWPLRWDITGANSWAPITAAGVLRRLRQGTNPVQSPLRRQLGSTADTAGYWPMEEGSGATYFLSPTPNTGIASFSGVTPASESSLPGGGPAPEITTAGGSIRMLVRPLASGGTGLGAMVLFKLPSIPSVKTRITRVRLSRGPGVSFIDFSCDATASYVEACASDGSVINSVVNLYGEDFTRWIAWHVEMDNTTGGGNTTIYGKYHAVGDTNYFTQSFTVAGTAVGVVSSMELTGAQSTAFAHAWLGLNTLPFVTNSFSLVSNGYTGELAAARFARICDEAGITYTISGGGSLTSEAMGAQKEGGTLAILQSCADTDYGVISERGAGLEFIPRNARWNLSKTLTITLAAGQIGDIPQPVRDDQRLRNKWTISRTGGGSGTYQDDTSVSRNGEWEDSATINSRDDSVLANHAAWRTNIGIQQRLRWPSIVLNFTRNPTLAAGWRSRVYGWRMGITTSLTQVKGNEPDVIVEGYQASLDPDIWTAELNCTDARVWAAAVADDTGLLGRADSEYCTTTALISATATSIPVTTATINTVDMPKWDTTAGLWSGNVDLNVGGEQITVNAVANGAGQAQTFTVVARGVNGYASIHPSGSSVSLWSPARVAL